MSLDGRNELEKFINKCGYNKIWSAVEEWLDENISKFEIDAYIDFSLYDIVLKFTRNLNVDGCCFKFEIVYEVLVNYTDSFDEKHNISQWISMHCDAKVDDELVCFDVADVEIYSKTKLNGNATPDFVPIISKNQMDAHAFEFLQRYYPEALTQPAEAPIREIAIKMGLNLEFGYILSEDFSYFGQISFSNSKTQVFNVETGDSQELEVTRGTILIDPEILLERSLGCENFTIVHELVHWEKHRLFADVKRLLYKGDYVAHRCPKPKKLFIDSDDEWTPEDWMEWQANGIGARILMPKETVPTKVNEITADFSDELKSDKTQYYITLIEELAEFYGTSQQATKYRLIELGYEEVEDIQIHEYDFQTYTHKIDEYKAYYELCENAKLRQLVNAGFFIYVDNYFVINHEKCVDYNEDGIPYLTDFAIENIEKCTVKFTNVRVNIKESGGKFSNVLYRGKTYETFQKYNSEDNDAMFEFAKELAADFDLKALERQKIRISFCDRVKQIFEAKDINSAKFYELTLLSRDIFSKLKRQNYKPKFETVIALCAGLDLDIFTTNELLQKAGYAFDESEKHSAYMTVITHFTGKSIHVRNEFLKNLENIEIAPLGEKDA